MPEKAILLDTCGLLWLASGDATLSPSALQIINNAPVTFVSAISAWEIGLKFAQGNLELPLEPEEWFNRVLEQHKLTLAPLDAGLLFSSTRLPWHHRDPADRFIIATALREDALVITADDRFPRYGVRTAL